MLPRIGRVLGLKSAGVPLGDRLAREQLAQAKLLRELLHVQSARIAHLLNNSQLDIETSIAATMLDSTAD